MSSPVFYISQSKLKTFRTCQQSYHYKYVRNIKRRTKAIPLERGSLIHACIEQYYSHQKKNVHWQKVISDYRTDTWDKLMDEEREYYGDLPGETTRIMTGYADLYRSVPEKIHTIESWFEYDLCKGIKIKGIIDRITSDSKGLWLVETKTHKDIPDENTRFLNIQTCLYIPACEQLGHPVQGVLWDYVRTKPPTIPKLLKKGGLSRAKDIDTDYATLMKAIEDYDLDPDDYKEELDRASHSQFFVRRYMPRSNRLIEAIRAEAIITAKEMQALSKYPVRSLSPWTCRGCEYRPLCEAELLGLDVKYLLKADYIEDETRQ